MKAHLRPDVLSMVSPQGSILGPLKFILYIAPLQDAILDYNLNCLFYARDSQVIISPSEVQRGGGGDCHPPLRFFLVFFLDYKTSAPDVFSSCSFTPRSHFERSAMMVSFYGYEI